MASSDLLVVKDKVQRYAKQFFNVIQIDDEGDLRIPYESTHVVISVVELNLSEPSIAAFHKENDISGDSVFISWISFQQFNLSTHRLIRLSSIGFPLCVRPEFV